MENPNLEMDDDKGQPHLMKTSHVGFSHEKIEKSPTFSTINVSDDLDLDVHQHTSKSAINPMKPTFSYCFQIS